ncbi:hypothetical protein MKW94_027567 [Papaver nudicaule]|uniref:Non-haem dioxygenase N-terminal domain-containing protein n=1 Tax=Papaver nudicaule TaxID=74823 RepID=A0AA41RSN1_PAPNU|nr:hypothetical protein [Papaver nudicaule]
MISVLLVDKMASFRYLPAKTYKLHHKYCLLYFMQKFHVHLFRIMGLQNQLWLCKKCLMEFCQLLSQIINHGISQSVLDEAIKTASNFFDLPNKYKQEFMSNDVARPVRYGTGLKDGYDVVQFWRIFLKHYAHPIEKWIEHWPSNPPDYRYAATILLSPYHL